MNINWFQKQPNGNDEVRAPLLVHELILWTAIAFILVGTQGVHRLHLQLKCFLTDSNSLMFFFFFSQVMNWFTLSILVLLSCRVVGFIVGDPIYQSDVDVPTK